MTNFQSYGAISNGTGSFILQAQTTTMTNGTVTGPGDINDHRHEPDIQQRECLLAGRMLQLTATNLLTDLGVTNTSFWSVGAQGISGSDSGFNLPIKPAQGDLLGTTVTNIAPFGKNINNLWAGLDHGYSNSGYVNNVAVGQLILDIRGTVPGTSPAGSTKLTFNGTGTNYTTNAIYVDCLQLHHYASYTNRVGTNLTGLVFSTNLYIYYAQALIDDGSSVAEKIDHFNNDHLRWVPTYAGIFSSTNIVYPDGTTNTANAALRNSSSIDSDGDGIPNASDSTPFLTSSEMNFTITVTNLPPKSARLQWVTTGNGTNYIYYKTNLLSPGWLPFTTFKNFYSGSTPPGTNGLHTNWFPSPFGFPATPAPVWIY